MKTELSSKLAQVIEQIPKDVLYDFLCSYAEEHEELAMAFFEIPRPLCLKGLHLSLYSLSSGEGKIDFGQRPPCVKVLV